jgi:hypothetical protein
MIDKLILLLVFNYYFLFFLFKINNKIISTTIIQLIPSMKNKKHDLITKFKYTCMGIKIKIQIIDPVVSKYIENLHFS